MTRVPSSRRAKSPRRDSSGDLQPILYSIARTAARLCEANDALIFRVEGDQIGFVAKHGRIPHLEALGDTVPFSRSALVGRAVLERRTIHVRDMTVAVRKEFPETRAAQRASGSRTVLVTPLLGDSTAIGAIVIRRTKVRPFTAKQIALLKTFADQAAIAIENARLFTELQARNHDLTEALQRQTATGDILRVISSSPTDIQPVLDAVAQSATRLCAAYDAVIFLLDGGALRVVAHHGAIPLAVGFVVPAIRGTVPGRSVLDRRTIQVADLQAETEDFPEGSTFARELGFRTALNVPLLREGVAIGLIALRRIEVQPFTESQIALLETFADQAVIAIENVRLFKELEARNRDLTDALEQQTATGEILRVISRTPTDAQPVFETIARNALRLCDGRFSAVFRSDGRLIHMVAQQNFNAAALEHAGRVYPTSIDGPGALAAVVREARLNHVSDVENDPRITPESLQIPRSLGARSHVIVPMIRGGSAIGAIIVGRTAVGEFSDAQIDLLQTFADQAVIAIENARLFKELEARNRDLTEALDRQTSTADVLRIIAQSPTELQPVLDAIAASAVRLCAASDVVIERLEGDRFYNAAHAGTQMKGLVGLPLPLTRRFPGGRAVLDRKPIILDDIHLVAETEYPDTLELLKLNTVHSAAEIPLLSEGKPLGSLAVLRAEVRPFTDAEVALLKTFADQAVIAIENVRLFTELQARNRELTEALEQQTATSEILRVISSSPTDVQPVFDAIISNAVRLCGAVYGIVWRYEGDLAEFVSAHNLLPEELEELRRLFPRRIDVDTDHIHTMMRSGTVLAVPDIEAYEHVTPQQRARWRARGVRSLLVAPMRRDREVIGAIGVSHRDVGAFSAGRVELLKTFADQAVIAIENARLFNELQARNQDLTTALEQQTATSEILRVISSSPTDVQPVFDVIAHSAARLCDGYFTTVVVSDGERLHLRATHNLPPEWRRDAQEAYPAPLAGDLQAARAVRERRVVHVLDMQEDPDVSPVSRRRAQIAGYRSWIGVPMLGSGGAVGTIAVSRRERKAFSDNEIALLQTFADQAVIAIENVRLFTELEARNRELTEALERQTATGDILRVIGSSPTNVQPIFDAIVRSASRLCGGEYAIVTRYDGELLNLVAQHNPRPGAADETASFFPHVPRRGASVNARALFDATVVHLPDVETEDFEPAAREFYRRIRLRAVLAVPMIHEGRPIGVVSVSRGTPGRFSDRQVDLLRTFADQAVIAIENVRLFNELQARTAQLTRSVEELTALGEVSRALSSTLDLETVLNTIVARANQLAGTDSCSVLEYDEQAGEFHLRATDNPDEEVVTLTRRRPIREGEGALGRMAVTREPVQIPDIAREDAYRGPLRDLLLRSGSRALLAVPLLQEGRLVGGLTVNKKTPGEFAPEIVELLKTFATQSALAIQNARLFREIEAKSRELEIASQHKSQFLANMSHELRTPLNAILGYTELIADGIYGELPEKMREVLERVQQSGRHLLGLINDILDLSKIEAGQLTLALGDYSMEVVAATVATAVEALAAEKKLRLDVTVEPDLPMGHGDERRLTQVLLNLVGNAIKFTETGSVGVRAGTTAGSFLVSVTDTGPGIAESDSERIFEEFQQATSTTTRAKGGTGLGLAIARRIIELHGGRLWVESTLGQGSTFSFTVPVRVEQQVPTTARRGSS